MLPHHGWHGMRKAPVCLQKWASFVLDSELFSWKADTYQIFVINVKLAHSLGSSLLWCPAKACTSTATKQRFHLLLATIVLGTAGISLARQGALLGCWLLLCPHWLATSLPRNTFLRPPPATGFLYRRSPEALWLTSDLPQDYKYPFYYFHLLVPSGQEL